MKVHVLLSWYDEKPDDLARTIASCAGLADRVVAVDGAYAHYPGGKGQSPPEQAAAIREAAHAHGMTTTIVHRRKPWAGGEVQKRAHMFAVALSTATKGVDWFLIMDGDQTLAPFDGATVRAQLEASDRDAAELNWLDIPHDENRERAAHTHFRSLFRALPGLTVEGIHWNYTTHKNGERVFLWQSPDARFPTAVPLDLTAALTMEHRQWRRREERDEARRGYYLERDREAVEFLPDYTAELG